MGGMPGPLPFTWLFNNPPQVCLVEWKQHLYTRMNTLATHTATYETLINGTCNTFQQHNSATTTLSHISAGSVYVTVSTARDTGRQHSRRHTPHSPATRTDTTSPRACWFTTDGGIEEASEQGHRDPPGSTPPAPRFLSSPNHAL